MVSVMVIYMLISPQVHHMWSHVEEPQFKRVRNRFGHGTVGINGELVAVFRHISPNRPNKFGVVTYPTGSPHGRGVPDIALNADPLSGWTIYYNKTLYVNQFGGTSCVAPCFSGLLGLFNLTYTGGIGKHLYASYLKQKTAFKDITTGSNDSLTKKPNYYNAGVGYDFCTGLGSLNGKLLYLALQSN